MAAVRVSSKRTWHAHVAWLFAAAIVCTVFPPFHVRPLNAPGETTVGTAASPTAQDSARQLWEQMLAARSDAIDATTLLQAIERDPAAAERQYGRRIGYGGPAFYFVRGEGRVTETTRKAVTLEIAGHSTQVRLVMGPVFGNVLRDATALADMGDFDSFQFNALSTELNLLSERRVQPRLADVSRPGAALRFVGGAKYVRRGSTVALELVPIDVERVN